MSPDYLADIKQKNAETDHFTNVFVFENVGCIMYHYDVVMT